MLKRTLFLALVSLMLASGACSNSSRDPFIGDAGGEVGSGLDAGSEITGADVLPADGFTPDGAPDLRWPDLLTDSSPETQDGTVQPSDADVLSDAGLEDSVHDLADAPDIPDLEDAAEDILDLQDVEPDLCVPNCAGLECGADGCGGSCGTCADDAACVDGACQSTDPCAAPPSSHLGCRFFAVDLDVYTDTYIDPSPDAAAWGLLVTNPGSVAADVTLATAAAGIVLDDPTVTIPAGGGISVVLPVMSVDGNVISDRTLGVVADRPVGIVQMNPMPSAAAANDSSLLYPDGVLGTDHWLLTWPTEPLEMAPIPGLESQHGYFAVVAVAPGTTQLQVTVPVRSKALAAYGGPLLPGELVNLSLQQGEVLQIEADGAEANGDFDLTGAHVLSDQPVAVFAGHEEAVVCGVPGAESCCADHLEEQLLPVSRWGLIHPCIKASPRSPDDVDFWRVQAGADNVTLATEPAVPGLDGVTLAKKGDWVEVSTKQRFLLGSDKPVQVMQYIAGKECAGGVLGDPAMWSAVPAAQYATQYQSRVPAGWTENHVTVVRAAGTDVTVNGNPATGFSAVGDGDFESAYVEVSAGPLSIACEEPCGAYLYGFSATASYGHPLGRAF